MPCHMVGKIPTYMVELDDGQGNKFRKVCTRQELLDMGVPAADVDLMDAMTERQTIPNSRLN